MIRQQAEINSETLIDSTDHSFSVTNVWPQLYDFEMRKTFKENYRNSEAAILIDLF